MASGSDPGVDQSVTLNRGEPSKLQPSSLHLHLIVSMYYRVTEAEGERGPWKVSTAGYNYEIHDSGQAEIFSYHWHPRKGHRNYHLHLEAGSRVIELLHGRALPTQRVSLEEVLRFLIVELKVRPLRRDWERTLEASQSRYEKYRTWS